MFEYKQVRETLLSYHNKSVVDEYVDYIKGLLSNQSQWTEKIHTISTFKISIINGNLYLYIKIENHNRWIRVSWRKSCCNLSLSCDPLKSALRNSVRFQVRKWKIQNSKGKACVLCKSTKLLQADHHDISFKELTSQFLEGNITPLPTEFGYCKYGRTFTKQERLFQKEWNKHHLENAKLQWLCKSCNLKKKRT